MYGFQQPIQGLIKVTNIEAARAYPLPPNSVVPLFDANEDVFYIKSTDGGGYPSLRTFMFTPVEPTPAPSEYVSHKELEELKEMILNVQQSIQSKEN